MKYHTRIIVTFLTISILINYFLIFGLPWREGLAATSLPHLSLTTSLPRQGLTTSLPMRNSTYKPKEECAHTSSKLVGSFQPVLEVIDWATQEQSRPELQPGGMWSPIDCHSRHRVAILLPYRDRDQHLHIFINNMHSFLQKQDQHYAIYVVEQAGTELFNKGILYNIAFTEALKDRHWTCIVLHDVDTIPMNDKNLYVCDKRPLHLAVALTKYGNKLPYKAIFGGATMLTTEDYRKVNGFSNIYWGWGSEDDDFHIRCQINGLKPLPRRSATVGKYLSLDHEHSPEAKDRFNKVRSMRKRHRTDGLKNLKYTILTREKGPLFTYILVNVGIPNTSQYKQDKRWNKIAIRKQL